MSADSVTIRRIAQLWWPLSMSWLMMGVELPLVTAIIARLPDDKANLAALSSLVYPLALLIEGPIIMLLAASTTLAKDWPSYRKLWRFTHGASLLLTLIHVAIAFTPIYDVVAEHLIKVPAAVVEPGRIGLQIMTPWTWAIASRRFQQGVLIRFERSRAVVAGTGVRLLTVCAVAAIGYFSGRLSGIAVGSLAIASGVVAEALYVSLRTQPVLREHIRPAPLTTDTLTWSAFSHFYIPLALTPFLTIVLQSVGAAAMNRMPEKLASTASWSSVYGLVFLFRTAGFAFNEVVVTLIAKPNGVKSLGVVAWGMAAAMTGTLGLLAVTPLGTLWFGQVTRLPDDLVPVAVGAIGFAVLMPGYAVLQSYYQGALVYARKTRAVTEAVILYLIISSVLLSIGVSLGTVRGIVFAICAFTIAGVLQTLWLRFRSAPILRSLERSE